MNMNGNISKQQILSALSSFVATRPNLEAANYASRADYQRDYRQHCLNPRDDYLDLENAISWRDSLTADDLVQAIRETNRVDLLDDGSIDYTPGQMGATEYRHAACNVLSRALWNHWRDDAPEGMTPREHIARTARSELGRGIAARYFN